MALFIKVDFGNPGAVDDGTRPYTGSVPFWNNNSIWLNGGSTQTQARVGDEVTLKVRVSNNSDASIEDVAVDAYVMNPFVGPFDPAHALERLRGFAFEIAPGSGSSSPSDSHVIDCQVHDPSAGPIPWKPTNAQLETNDGHLCIVANAYADNDGAPITGTTPFQVKEDEHLGQRNIGLLPKTQQMKLMVMPAIDGGPTELIVQQLTSKALLTGERWLLRSRYDISKMRGPYALGIPGRGDRDPRPLSFSRMGVRGGFAVEGMKGGNIRQMATIGRKLLKAPLLEPLGKQLSAKALARPVGPIDGRFVLGERDKPVFANIKIDRADKPGSLQAFDVIQRDVKGRIIGGYRVLSMQT